MKRCACEDGFRCTPSTVCCVESAVQDTIDELAPHRDFELEVIQYAIDYMNEYNHGKRVSKARSNLFEAIQKYEAEIN